MGRRKSVIFYLILLTGLYSLPTYAGISKKCINKIITEIQADYNIKLFYDTIPASTWQNYISYEKITEEDYKKFYTFLKLFKNELYKYPKEFIDTTNLKYVAFVKNFTLSGQHRTALPDYIKEMLIYDIIRGRGNKTYVRHIIHHEFYHMIEEQFNKSVYYKDSTWAKFNISDSIYGKGGASVQERGDQFQFIHPNSGFINRYAMSALEEDKAELYASLFIRKENRKVRRWSRRDEVLKNKTNYMKLFLSGLCMNTDKRFW